MTDLTRNAAVVGSPISHSLSPALHRAASRALGLDWTYAGLEVTVEQLPDFLAGLDASWAGLSLTMPLKEAVLDLAGEISWTAHATTSANTLLRPARQAHSTDVDGIATALRRRPGSPPNRDSRPRWLARVPRPVLVVVVLHAWESVRCICSPATASARHLGCDTADRLGRTCSLPLPQPQCGWPPSL